MVVTVATVIACPNCGALEQWAGTKLEEYQSAHRLYSRLIYSALPQPRIALRCHECENLYWLNDATTVGSFKSPPSIQQTPAPIDWQSAPDVYELSPEDCLHEVSLGHCRTEADEIDLRTLAWMGECDEDRFPCDPHCGPRHELELWRENLMELVRLIDTSSDNNRVLKAEILRELGRFEEGLNILGDVTTDYLKPLAEVVAAQCQSQYAGKLQIFW